LDPEAPTLRRMVAVVATVWMKPEAKAARTIAA